MLRCLNIKENYKTTYTHSLLIIVRNDRNELITIMVNERRIKNEVDGSKIGIVLQNSFCM